MWATWANLGPRQGQTCAQIGPTSANNNNTTTTTTTPARADGSAFAGARLSGVSLINPAMPRRVVVAAKHSFSYQGARPCRRPSPKILQPAGVFTFVGVRGGKKDCKIWRCVLEVLVGRFLVDFWWFFHIFLVLSTRKNRVIYNVFVALASKKSFWQHAGNYVNTSVFARPGPQTL